MCGQPKYRGMDSNFLNMVKFRSVMRYNGLKYLSHF